MSVQVHARSQCVKSAPISYFIIERNDSNAFQIENTTGVFKLRSYVFLNSTFQFLVEARLQDGDRSVNSPPALVVIQVIARDPLNFRTTVNFETEKLGFLQDERISNREQQFGFFVNGYPGSEGRLRAFVGGVSAGVNYTITRERAVYVKAVLVNSDVYWDRPAVRVIAQVQDSSYNVRTLVDESEVVVKVEPSANLSEIDGSLLQSISKPSASSGIAEIEVTLPSQWFSDPSLVDPEVVTITYRLRNSAMSPMLLGNATIHSQTNTQLFANDVYGALPLESVFVGGVFSLAIYCDSSYAVASFGIKLLVGPSLVIVGSQVDGQQWVHAAVNHSSNEWVVSATLTDPESAPEGYVKKAKLVSFDVKVTEMAEVNTNDTITAEVAYLSNINNEEVHIGGESLPVMAAMIDGSSQVRHTLGTIRIVSNGIKQLLPYAEPSVLVNTAVINGQIVTADITLLAVRSSGDVTLLSEANCTSLTKAVQVYKNCSRLFLNGSEPEGSPEARVHVEYGHVKAIVSVRVWFPVLPLNLTLSNTELAEVSGWLEFRASSGKCSQRYQWSEVHSEALFTYDGVHFGNMSTTSLARYLLSSLNDSVAAVDSFGNVHGMSPGQATVRAVNPLNGVVLGSAEVTVTSLRRVAVQVIDIVMVTNLSVSIPTPPYPRLSTKMAIAFVHQDLRRDHTRGALVACVTFSDGRRQKLNSGLGLQLKSLDDHVLRITGQSEAISVGSGAGMLQAEWYLPASVCYPSGFSLGVGYEMTNVTLSRPIRLEITGVSPQITVPGDKSTFAGIPTSSGIVVTLVFENEYRVDMSSDSRTVYDLSKSEGFFTVYRDHNNVPVIEPSSGKFGRKDLVVRFTHFTITGSVSINTVQYLGLALEAKPYPSYHGSSRINTLSRIADTSSHEMASLSLAVVFSDGSNYDITRHELTSFSSKSPDVIVGQNAANRVTVKPGVNSATAIVEGYFSGIGNADMLFHVRSSSVYVSNITDFLLLPENNGTLSGVENSPVAQVKLSLTFSNGRQVAQFYDGSSALFSGLITLASENSQIFTVDSNTGQITLRRNYHQTLSLTATAAVSMVTASVKVACNLQPAIGDVDLGEESGVPLPPRVVGALVQIQARLNAGGGPGVKRIDLTLSFDQTKLAVVSVTGGGVLTTCIPDLSKPGQISINCVSDSLLTGLLEIADITFNATSQGLASILGSVTTDVHNTPSLVAGDVDQEILGSGKRRRRSLDGRDRRDVLEAHKQRMRSSVFCATPPCQCDDSPLPGDVNKDCLFDLGDVIFLLRYYSFSVFDFSNPAGNLLLQSLTSNQTSDLDVDKNTVVNPADAFYLVRTLLGLVRFVSAASVTPVQVLSSDCQLSFSVTLMSKNGPASDADTFVFFDLTYRGSSIDFAGSTGSQRGIGIYGNLIRGVSQGNGTFDVQSPFELVQNSLGFSVFHVTLDSNNKTSVRRLSALLGSPSPPYLFPFRLSVDLQVSGQTVSINTNNNYNPFAAFNNTLSSADCINYFTPQFGQLFYHTNVSENVTVNSSVITVNATDMDKGDSGRIRYSLVSDYQLPFAVNSTSGVIRTIRSLDREEKAWYNLTVRATDGGAPGREKFAHAYVFVMITDVNDNAPVVSKIVPGHVIKIPENAVTGNPLARVIASDADVGENAQLGFSIIGNSSWNGTFVMNETTGEVMLNRTLQGKVGNIYKVVVLISDHGVPVLTANTTVEFRITFASDVEIFFISKFYKVNLTENSPENTSVVHVTAYVPGLPMADIVYSISDNETFKIDSSTGEVLVNSTIDRESNEFFVLSVTARYGQNISTNATVNITVLDENDNAPIPYPVPLRVIPYNLPVGSVVWQVNASDRDIGRNAVLKFSFVEDAVNLFVINRESGKLFLNSSLLDLNQSFVQLAVEIFDSGVPHLSSNITVNISVLFPPRFSHRNVNITLPEDTSIDSVVYTFTPMNISGQDLDTYFTISNGNFGEKFSIRNLSGEVFIQESLDREEISFYSLSFQASNLAAQRFAEIQPTELLLNITVLDVNDNAPYLEAVKPITIKNTAHVGYTLLRVNATDADEGLNAQLQFRITSGNELHTFVINELGFLQLNRSILYDSVPWFFLSINVTDLGSPVLYNTTGINITVEDDRSPLRFNRTFYNASILEDVPAGSEVVTVTASDPNGDRIFYNISSTLANVVSIFKVNSSTGVITTVADVDREIQDMYEFEVNAYKFSPLTGERYLDNASVAVHVLDVNDVRPRFEQSVYTVQLDEENSPGVVLVSVHANDTDQGLNSLLSYTIIAGNRSIFSVNSSNGEITVLKSLDYEKVHQLNLTVQAKDHGTPPLEANVTVIVYIRDINDNAPIIESNLTYNVSLLENVQQGTFVFQINASDADSGPNSNLSFSIVHGNLGNAFTINPTNGIITTQAQLDYEKEAFYTLNVSVEDQGIPPLQSSILVTVEVIDVNDMTPVIDPLFPVYVRENVPIDTVITRVNATDGDSGINAVLNFTIVSGNQAGDFIINERSGVVTTAQALDHENVSSYTLNISVIDNGVPPLSSNALVVIYVIDVNDHRPIFSQDLYEASIYENFTVNSTVLRVHARDLDSSTAGGIVYSLHKSNDNDTFMVNSSSGEIKLERSLDFEETKHYSLVVKATDTFLPNDTLDIVGAVNDSNSSISFFSFANVSLFVLDVNDNPPRFARDFYSVLIGENLPAGSLIAQVNATDQDSGDNAEITYELLATELFVVNGSSGEVRTKGSLRDSNYLTFDLSIVAVDKGMPPLNNTALLQVRIHYNVTFKYNETYPLSYVARDALQVEPPVMLSSVYSEAKLGLFSQMSGDIQVSAGNIQRTEKFEVLKEPALYIKAALVSDWPDYHVIRIAVQVFDRNFNVKTAPTKVYFKLINLDTDLEVNNNCVPSTNTGICVGRLSVPEEWLNTSVSTQNASVQYGLLLSNMAELKRVTLTGRLTPQVEGNFVILAPLYLLNVGDAFLLEIYAQYPKLVNYFTLIFTVSTGLKINGVKGSPSWSVQTTFNGANEFVVFGVRKNGHSGDISASAVLYFTIDVEIAENAIMESPEYMECTVNQVSDQEGTQLIDTPMKAVFEDRFGRNEIGRFVVVEDDVSALFVVADFSVVVNTAVLNGRRIDVPLVVYGVTASGRPLNVTSGVNCRSLDADVLKVSKTCSSAYVNGSETRGSTEAIIEFSHQNLATNYSFTVWTPTVPVSLSAKPAKLKLIRDWYDPSDSCKSRYQHARVTVTTELSDGKQSTTGVDVTQHVKNNLRSSNISVAEITGLNVLGKSVGKATIEVYNAELAQSLGEFIVEVTIEETRVYIIDAVIATRIFVALPKSLNNSVQHAVSVTIDQTFSTPEDEGSVVVSLQYSDGVINTFDSLQGFYINSTNSSMITVQEGRITAANDGSGNLIHVALRSGHCTMKPTINSRASVDVNFQEPVAVLLTLCSRQITPRGDPAEAIGVSLSTELKVTLVYNISGREHRVDVTNDNRTVYNMESGDSLVSFVVTERAVVISASGAGFGQVEMSVKFTHVQTSGQVAIDVIGTQELTFYASPHPAFNMSTSVNVTQLNPIGNSGDRQQARLHLILVLTNGSSNDISRDAKVRFEITATQPAELAQNSFITATDDGYHVVSVQWRGEEGQLAIKGSYMGVSSHLLLQVESTPITVTSVEVAMPPNLTLSGLRDRSTLQLSVNLKFSDDSKLLGLFSSENRTLFDLVTFSTDDTTKISLNETSGLVTLKDNSPQEVRVTVSAVQSPLVKDSFSFACNLDPDVGDVDIGDITGVPLKPAHVGDIFLAPVRINSGDRVLGSFDVEIVYDSELLDVVSINEGADMTGFFVADKSSQTAKVRIAGALSVESQDHPVRHVADVKFRVISSGTARVSGTVQMIAADDLVGSVIGPPVPRNIVAGDIEVATDNNLGRLRRSLSSARTLHPRSSRNRRSAVACPSPPCTNCTNGKREPGDTDGNCIFDIRDVKFTLAYLTEQQFNFTRVRGQQIQNSLTQQQLQALDANGDGSVTLNDVNLLLRANLEIVSLSPALKVVPVQDRNSKCLLTISVSASQLGIDPSDANRTKIFFDVSHSDQNFSNSLRDSVFRTGALDTAEKGIPGGIFRAEFNSAERRFVASLNTSSLVYSNIGLSLVQVRFANDGSLDFTRTTMVNGLFTRPPLYQGALNATLDLGNGRRYSIRRPNGYNPYTFFSIVLASSNCSDYPLLENDIALVALGARRLLASWKLANVRQGLNFSFTLRLRLCDPAQLNEPCEIRALQVSGINYTLTGLKPYTSYSVKVETTGLPLRETLWETVRTLESVPEGVNPPVLEVSSSSSLNASWTQPEHPNGVIVSYSLHMRNLSSYSVLYQGTGLSYHVTGLSAGQEYFFYIMAYTSIGGTKSSVVSSTIPLEKTPSSGARDTDLSVEVIVGITIGCAAFIALLIILLVWLVRRNIQRKQPNMLDYRSLHKYNSLDVSSSDNLAMELRSTSSLQGTGPSRGRKYEHHFRIDGLENPWKEQELEDDSGQDTLAVVNQRHFEPGPVRTSNWDPGYEETVLKEAAQEMNALDAAMKENSNTNINTFGHTQGLNGYQSSLQEDNLVHMSRQSRRHSSFSPENTGRKKSKKKKEDDYIEWDYYYARGALTEGDHFQIEETKL